MRSSTKDLPGILARLFQKPNTTSPPTDTSVLMPPHPLANPKICPFEPTATPISAVAETPAAKNYSEKRLKLD